MTGSQTEIHIYLVSVTDWYFLRQLASFVSTEMHLCTFILRFYLKINAITFYIPENGVSKITLPVG
jgi:hypothetical protein